MYLLGSFGSKEVKAVPYVAGDCPKWQWDFATSALVHGDACLTVSEAWLRNCRLRSLWYQRRQGGFAYILSQALSRIFLSLYMSIYTHIHTNTYTGFQRTFVSKARDFEMPVGMKHLVVSLTDLCVTLGNLRTRLSFDCNVPLERHHFSCPVVFTRLGLGDVS